MYEHYAWALKWRSTNQLDGERENLIGAAYEKAVYGTPACLDGYAIGVFKTRQAARDHAKRTYGYIAGRPDLRAEPHGWRMPQVVKVRVTVEEK